MVTQGTESGEDCLQASPASGASRRKSSQSRQLPTQRRRREPDNAPAVCLTADPRMLSWPGRWFLGHAGVCRQNHPHTRVELRKDSGPLTAEDGENHTRGGGGGFLEQLVKPGAPGAPKSDKSQPSALGPT